MSDHTYQRFSDRFFEVSPLFTKPGWYARLREDKAIGPFRSREAAHIALSQLFGLPLECSGNCEVIKHYTPDSRLP